MGEGFGWVGLDPTNDIVVRDEHVVLAWGRDFIDVSPLSGVILGGGEHGLRVGVDLEEAEAPVTGLTAARAGSRPAPHRRNGVAWMRISRRRPG